MPISFSTLIEQYLQGINTVREAVAGMTDVQIKARPMPEKWTTLEVIAHLSDFEPVFTERMKRIISHDRPLLLVADENLFSTSLAYESRDLEEELTLIEVTRKQMARILKTLPTEVASRTGVHSQKGLISLEAVLSGAVGHINHHVKFIHEKRVALKV